MKCVAFLFFVIVSCVADDFKLLVLHNNDMHARFEETSRSSGTCKGKNCVGGFARTSHVIKEARRNASEGIGPSVLFLNAGDTYTGTAWYGVHKWKIVVEFLNLLKPDAASLGNHEFDNGPKGLLPYLENANFPIIAANLDFKEEPELANSPIKKSVILDVEGRKIGVIGYLTPETAQISSSQNVKFLDEVEIINEESKRLEEEGVNIIIALGHSGFETDKSIAKNCPLVDLVIGGHTNTFLWNGPPPDEEKPEDLYPKVITQDSGKKVPVVQAYAYTKYLGFLNLIFNEKGDLTEFDGQPLLLDTKIPQDPEVLAALEKYRPAVLALDEEVVGKSRVLLDGSANECRFRECNFGNLIADAFVAYRMSLYGGTFWTDTPIGLMNGGAIRNSINSTQFSSNITRGELLGCIPFDNQMYTLSLNGTDLLKTLELGVRSNGETSRGEFLQVSGLRVKYDLTQPVGARVVSVKVRCAQCEVPHYEPLDEKKSYRIITNGFLVIGGDGHYIIQKNSMRKKMEDLNDLDVVSWYIKQYSPVYPGLEERITFVKSDVNYQKSTATQNFGTILTIIPSALTMLLMF